MKKWLCLCLLFVPFIAHAQTEEPASSAEINLPIRAQRPHSVTLGGIWPRGINLEYQYQATPTWGLGGYVGSSLFNVSGGLFSRWYQSQSPATWYWEALLSSSWLGSSGPYTFGSNGIGANGLIGWEYRSPEGFTIRVGTGLGLSTFSTVGAVSPGLLLQLNLDAAIGYAF